jgi:hypothetical protein
MNSTQVQHDCFGSEKQAVNNAMVVSQDAVNKSFSLTSFPSSGLQFPLYPVCDIRS